MTDANHQPQPLNILYIHSHDTGRYLQPYGYAVPTPNLQCLAEEGVLCRQAFAAAPTCSPSRTALLTGQSPHSAGLLGLVHRGFKINDPTQHLAHFLRSHGYDTALFGMHHTAKNPAELGYDVVEVQQDRHVKTVAPQAVEFIRQRAASRPSKPLFLDVGFFETHRPFPQADPQDARYVRPPAPLPDTPQTRQDMADYILMARELDRGVGMVLDALAETGMLDSTLVISTTDHGLAFPAMKCNLTDHGIGVSLIMRGPEPFRGGRVIDSLISQIDIFPTLCDVLGLEKPAWLQGKSFLPVLTGEVDEINDEIFAEVTFHAAYEPQRAIRTQGWTYIRRFGESLLPVLPNCDDGHSRDLWLDHGWAEHPHDPEQLYDNIFDPVQMRNLADRPEFQEVRADLSARLDAWMRRTDDPLLHGPVAIPPGASANDPTARSFSEELLVADENGQLRVVPNPRTLA